MADQDEPLSKRRRVAESCQSCRTRKIRCGGQRPTCSTCSYRRVTCKYDPDTTPQLVPQQTLEDLNARLRFLESRLEATTARDLTHEESHMDVHVTDNQRAATPTESTTLRYIHEMINATDEEADSVSLQHSSHGSGPQSHPPQDPSGRPPDAQRTCCLPIDADLDTLVERYMELAYPLFPILSIPTFEYDYKWCRASVSGICSRSATFHATVNIVCALGCLLGMDESGTINASRATIFYERTRNLAPLDSFDHPTLADVQLLLLVVQYLTFTVYINRAHQTLAITIRIAQGLGLDRDAYTNTQDEVEHETVRRVWYLCITFERCVH